MSISMCETAVVWNMGRTNALKCLWIYRAVVNTDCFKNTSASNAAVTLDTHISSVHWLEVSETIKIEHIKSSLEKMTPHPEKTERITQTFHKLMWQKRKRKKKNTEPRVLIELKLQMCNLNESCSSWCKRGIETQRQMVNKWDDWSCHSKCVCLLPLVALEH